MSRGFISFVFLSAAFHAVATPQFAREYDLPCARCHIHVPKLNDFGERFLAAGYRLPDARKIETTPLAVWTSALAQNRGAEPERFKTIPNRIELVAAGNVGESSYFVEWRLLSREFLSDMSVRDRSGRFEDLFVLLPLNGLALQVGQFRALSQIDVSRRLNLAEPAALSSSLAGRPDSDARTQSLRGFSLAGRAPSVRLHSERNGWNTVITMPLPGELSLPLTEEARRTASFELEASPKGMLLEGYRRKGVDSYGAHIFTGDNRRLLVGAATQQRVGDVWLEATVNRAEVRGAHEWRGSLGVEYIPTEVFALGVRVDHRWLPGQRPTALPFLSLLGPFGEQAVKLVLEARLQEGRRPRLVGELSWMF